MTIIRNLHYAIVTCDRAQQGRVYTISSSGGTLASQRQPFRSTIIRTGDMYLTQWECA